MILDKARLDAADALETEVVATATGVSAAGWPPSPSRPAFDLLSSGENAQLRQRLLGAKSRVIYEAMRVAVIDFAGTPSYALAFDGQGSIGSLAKLGILYTAFQLREDVRGIVRAGHTAGTPIRDVDTLERKLRDVLTANIVGQPRPPAPDGRRWLEWIFGRPALTDALNRNDPNAINFDEFSACGLDSLNQPIDAAKQQVIDKLSARPHNSATAQNWDAIAQFPFGHRLWMTTGWSDNLAATMCAFELGPAFIASVLRRSGLADGRGLGLWFKLGFQTPPAGHHTRFTRVTMPAPPASSRYPEIGIPSRLAALMVALQRGSLVSSQASADMRRLLRPVGYGSGTPVPTRILTAIETEAGSRPTEAWLKGGKATRGGVAICDWTYFEVLGRKLGIIVLDAHRGTGDRGDNMNEEDRLAGFVAALWRQLRA